MSLSHLEIVTDTLENLGYQDVTPEDRTDPYYLFEKEVEDRFGPVTIKVRIEEVEDQSDR